jgi:plastocyanin
MRNRLKRNISLVAITSLFGLFLTSCTQTNGSDYRQENNSESHMSAPPTASPKTDMSMSNMKPLKAMADTQKTMTSGAAASQVIIENFSFAPATLTVKAGTRVTWINRDDVPHTVDENDKRFKSGTMDTDDQFSYTFSSPGTFSYFCALHPKMVGQIIVK